MKETSSNSDRDRPLALATAPVAHADNDWIAMAMSDSTGQIKSLTGDKPGAAGRRRWRRAQGHQRLSSLASGQVVHRACLERCENMAIQSLSACATGAVASAMPIAIAIAACFFMGFPAIFLCAAPLWRRQTLLHTRGILQVRPSRTARYSIGRPAAPSCFRRRRRRLGPAGAPRCQRDPPAGRPAMSMRPHFR